MTRTCWLLVLAIALLTHVTLGAQSPRRTVRGEVRDTAGQPIDAVDILALTAGRRTRSGSDGRFQLDSFPVGEERFLFRRLGFNPVEASLIIRVEDQDIVVRMTPVAQELTPILVSGRRSSIVGFVMDIQDQPIPGAEVHILGGASATKTDSLGRFVVDRVPAGTFMVMVRKRGYFVARRSVTLPPGESLDISFLLASVPSGLSNRRVSRLAGFGGLLGWAWSEHAARRVQCTGSNAIFVPREELAEQGHSPLDLALSRAPSAIRGSYGRANAGGYELFVDGRSAAGWSLSAIRADHVEAVEIYRPTSSARRPLPRIMSFGNAYPAQPLGSVGGGCPAGSIWVWTR